MPVSVAALFAVDINRWPTTDVDARYAHQINVKAALSLCKLFTHVGLDCPSRKKSPPSKPQYSPDDNPPAVPLNVGSSAAAEPSAPRKKSYPLPDRSSHDCPLV